MYIVYLFSRVYCTCLEGTWEIFPGPMQNFPTGIHSPDFLLSLSVCSAFVCPRFPLPSLSPTLHQSDRQVTPFYFCLHPIPLPIRKGLVDDHSGIIKKGALCLQTHCATIIVSYLEEKKTYFECYFYHKKLACQAILQLGWFIGLDGSCFLNEN